MIELQKQQSADSERWVFKKEAQKLAIHLFFSPVHYL